MLMQSNTLVKYRAANYMKCILALVVQFQLWDGFITQVFVNGAIVKDANPLIMPLVSNGEFMVIKLLGAALCIAALLLLYRLKPNIAFTSAAIVALFYIGVITWNFSVVFNSI